MSRVPKDVEEPREIPMLGDLIIGLDPQESLQRRIAPDFGQAGVIGGVPQQRREHGDAPEQRDRVVVAAAAPRPAEALEQAASGTASRQRRTTPSEGESSSAAQANRG